MSNLIQIKVAELNQLNPLMIAEDNRVEQKFIQMYNAIWGTAQGAQIYEKEKFNFRKILQDKPELQRCTPLSLYGCFLDIAVNGLSLDPTGRPHCYILPRSTKTGYKDNNGSDIYELRAYLSITGYGELVMRQRAGQVRYVDNPVVCYEGDTFSPRVDRRRKDRDLPSGVPPKVQQGDRWFLTYRTLRRYRGLALDDGRRYQAIGSVQL